MNILIRNSGSPMLLKDIIFSVWIFLLLFSFIHRQGFSLPPKTFYITVSTVIVGYLLLPAIFFIRKATRSERGESEKNKK